MLISFVSLQCADLPKVQNFLVVGDNVFEAPLIVKQCDFSFLHPHISSQEGVKDTTNGNLHQKLHNKMLWGRKQSYLYIWKYLNLIRFSVINLSVGGHCASHAPQNTLMKEPQRNTMGLPLHSQDWWPIPLFVLHKHMSTIQNNLQSSIESLFKINVTNKSKIRKY